MILETRELEAIYIMWLRQVKRFLRSKSRMVATIVQPLFFLVILGSGLRSAMLPGMKGDDYVMFLTPGIVTMAILFSSMTAGVSILWDKQFGFLQEVLVAPVSRFSIIIGRILGGSTIALFQGFIILFIAFVLGTPILGFSGLFFTMVFMVLIAFTAVGFGIILASKMEDFQGFQLIMNLVMMPLLFMSSAFFPIATNPGLPDIIVKLSFLNPLFYMVDGMRGSIIGVDNYFSPLVDFAIVAPMCILLIAIGSYLFSKSEA